MLIRGVADERTCKIRATAQQTRISKGQLMIETDNVYIRNRKICKKNKVADVTDLTCKEHIDVHGLVKDC